ncbi:MAG: PQQ-binding-like beta-propeller repeat protein [Gemmataceae bacterium]|nr:PQQ-binding-like beta-propeller repeat protein [Gemmataceae bacterium]
MPSRHHAALALRLALLAALVAIPGTAGAADWPAWRCDAGRTAASPHDLPTNLHLQWVREYPALKPAWPDQRTLQFDTAYEPVVAGKLLFVGSSRSDSVTALDTATGAERWRFHADGPVRFAPTAWDGRLYVASDDGHLYCLDAAKGTVVWKFRGGPADRRILGNERLISAWPARGAPVVHDGKVYFAASIWPFMGTFIHCLDARTGAPVWTNDGDGSIYVKQPHNSDSFAGVAPQGYLVASEGRLIVPGGRSVPACYDLATGKLLRYVLSANNRRGGGPYVAAAGQYYFNGGAGFEAATQKFLGTLGGPVVLVDDMVYTCSGSTIRALDLKGATIKEETTVDRKGKKIKSVKWKMKELGSVRVPGVETIIRAGGRLYAAAEGEVVAFSLPFQDDAEPAWRARVEGTPVSLAAADDRLFVATREGRLYCFGADHVKPATHHHVVAAPAAADEWTARAHAILEQTGVREGYAVVWGAGTGRLAAELARQSQLRLIVVERDARQVADLRARLAAAGLYGERVAVLAGDPLTFPLPPYLASLLVSEDLAAAGVEPTAAFAKKAFHALRPYGGVACLPVPADRRRDVGQAFAGANLVNAKVGAWADGVLLTREGALPGSANWTHEHADAANTRVSKDQLVKAPLAVLWFGGPSNEGVLPRHGHGPQPQVLDGRLFIEGIDMLRALDIYTGRLLWETKLPGVGTFYNNTAHQPGANSSGTNYISTRDGIYIVHDRACVRLDPATGKKLGAFTLPPAPGSDAPPRWGYINVFEDYLVGSADPLLIAKADVTKELDAAAKKEKEEAKKKKPASDDEEEKAKENDTDSPLTRLVKKLRGANDSLSSSKELVVMDRRTGEMLWRVKARTGFRHNSICIGGGRLYAIDRLSGPEQTRLKRRGEEPKYPPRLVAFDLKTGREVWATEENVFGTWMSYSARHEVLMESGRGARDTISDEPRGMRAYRADTGKVLWFNAKYVGPAMIHGDHVLRDQAASHILTGEPKLREHPLTGMPTPWEWVRNYGCNTPMAAEHLLTFRSGAAGYFDLCGDSGTGNFGGFRSSCTNNLVVAGGVLTAPDYTRTCTCLYQNQSSLGLVHDPDAEMWTTFGVSSVKGTIQRVGVNFGAPGDRKDEAGTLWLEFPSVAGKSPAVPVKVAPAKVELFRRHESAVEGNGLKWVAASGVKGVETVTVGLSAGEAGRTYTVRLHFLEPDRLKAGQRVFDVALQGREVLKAFDVAREAGGPNRSVVKEFRGVRVTDELTVTFRPSANAAVRSAVLCGVEVRAEGQ